MKKLLKLAVSALAVISMFVQPLKANSVELIGAGATFPYPLYSKMFDVYNKEHGIKINYSAIGSGGGIRQLMSKTVDFGGTDAFLTDKEMIQMPGSVAHIPTCIGAVVFAFNVPGVTELNLTPDVIAGIFLGKIKKWSAPEIKKINQKVKLPDINIAVIHRSDGSGTTFIFSDYLSKISNEWKNSVGAGTSLKWPCGLGAKGNPGVAGLIKQIPGSIGYVELIYALSNKIPFASVQNKSGIFIKPSLLNTSIAANVKLPDDMRVSITNTNEKNGYSISGFTWIIVYKEQNYDNRSFEKTKALVDLLWWMTHQGQRYTENLQYAPLSKEAVVKAERIIRTITYNGEPIIK